MIWEKGGVLICDAGHGVSTGSGSDRVSIDVHARDVRTATRSLPLPVLTLIQLGLDVTFTKFRPAAKHSNYSREQAVENVPDNQG